MATDHIADAFHSIDRADFVPKELKGQAAQDTPLPIGFRQTISQPSTVRRMLKWLDPQPGEKILDIGSGSGWTTALLSKIVGEKGSVFAVEKIPKLREFGKSNCAKVGIENADFFQAGSEYGLPKHSPYDRILVSAAAQKLPSELLDQLKIGGKLVIPVQNDILEITKTSENEYETEVHGGYIFVPLV